MTLQILSFCGAMMILIAYVGHQIKRINSRSVLYNLLNAIGSAILAYVALRPFQIGFVLLESVWTLVSLWALFAARRTRLS